MSLLTFDEARPWAKSIKTAILSRKMPPWFAETQGNHTFSNDRTLSTADLNTLAQAAGLTAAEITAMPANNLVLAFTRAVRQN